MEISWLITDLCWKIVEEFSCERRYDVVDGCSFGPIEMCGIFILRINVVVVLRVLFRVLQIVPSWDMTWKMNM